MLPEGPTDRLLRSSAAPRTGSLGACHGLDVPLVFGNLDRGQPAALIGDGGTGEGTESEAETLSARMRSAWTSFAANGDPGRPAYDRQRRLVQLFDAAPSVTACPEEPSRLIWRDHTFPVLPLHASDGSEGQTPGR
ncbi:hypothetical protein [Streptomyces sp. Je 1-369]|uniref:hypothetical protein n=1 Tax=Streptomyces sp. Je 1-369 TaxID=2966192 RepID=UPI0022857D1D|nr:hypothetical protein [Streptomyces sp. Je 1-369]WAL94051.1 hypothetical protein NOO62_05760 [Streptomyces sp. Je 1-369]